MLLKTVHQWDIDTQDHLNRFREESEEIHRSVVRTIYREGPEEPDYDIPSRQRVRKEKPEELPPPIQETEADWASEAFPSRAVFLDRLAKHLKRRKNGKYDGYSIVVKAVVEHRDGRAVRAEFVEMEGPRLEHLFDPNGGRILGQVGGVRGYVVEDQDGNIRPESEMTREESQKCGWHQTRLLLALQQDLDWKDRWLLQDLMDHERDEGTLFEIWEKDYRKELAKQLRKQAAGA